MAAWTTLAYAIGEMSFGDADNNNLYTVTPKEDYQDLGDPYLDPKFRGYFEPGLQAIPYGNAASCAKPDSINFYLYDSLEGATPTSGAAYLQPTVPSKPGTCRGSWGQSYVRSAIQTVWSTSGGASELGSHPALPASPMQPRAAVARRPYADRRLSADCSRGCELHDGL